MDRPKLNGIFLGVSILLIGGLSMGILFSLRKPPAEASASITERSLSVSTVLAEPTDIPITLRGYGETRPHRTATISPQVAGVVVNVHSNLVVGGVIKKGETLFEVDPRDYRIRVDEARATEAQMEISVRRLKTEYSNDEARLTTLERTRQLALDKFERAEQLLKEDIGNQSEVDSAEQLLNNTIDFVDVLRRDLNIYPIRIEEARQSLSAAQAKTHQAKTDLERTRVLAPFDARVAELSIELGQSALVGDVAVTLADDSVLEVSVKLDARDARMWLQFDSEASAESGAWFHGLSDMPCIVAWTEDDTGHRWEGALHRVENFDSKSRTLTVAVRIPSAQALPNGGTGLPLVAGMFCEVHIPGKTMKNVYTLPQHSVSVDDTICLSKEKRLRTVPVNVVRRERDSVYISEGLVPGDEVIITRLISPLENTLLETALQPGILSESDRTTE